jgi:response regulator RpfG family c-di-GMP phosphodiesterase
MSQSSTPPEPPLNRTQNFSPHEMLGSAMLRNLLNSGIIVFEDWQALANDVREQVIGIADIDQLLARLSELNLLTTYQVGRIRMGRLFGLVLGNYRILDRIGAGGMGVVYRAEHLRLRRLVAIKVLSSISAEDPRSLSRFHAEMRAVGQLRHPNIVGAYDCGEVNNGEGTVLHYLVMEYVEGLNLERLVSEQGPLSLTRTCDLGLQVANALAEAHRHKLIHRDIKPSNIIITPDSQAKLLDFGLACGINSRRLTDPGAVLGTLGYMAPEQAQDPRKVDQRADIYSLGATLFWAITGHEPFPLQGNVGHDLVRRMTMTPPSLRQHRPDVSVELDHVLSRMMAPHPDDRFQTAEAVRRALQPFVQNASQHLDPSYERAQTTLHQPNNVWESAVLARPHRILLVDDEPDIRRFCKLALRNDSAQCEEAGDGEAALKMLHEQGTLPFDLVLLDVDMPGCDGLEVLRQVRANPPSPHLKVVMLSGRSTGDELAQMLLAGADDYLIKPFSVVQFRARVKTVLRLKDAQERADQLNQHLRVINTELERNLSLRDGDLVQARNALVLALARLVEQRSTESGNHLLRLQRYCRYIAEEALNLAAFAGQVDASFIDMLESCSPLHDIGKVALPDHILLKPGKLDPDERILMQAHTTIGAETLTEVAKQFGFAGGFLHMAADIARHHHERFDGTGYPDRLVGNDIPLAARIVSLADVYDALRSRRVYKPALSHSTAMMAIIDGSPGQFDPALIPAFQACAPKLERVFREYAG